MLKFQKGDSVLAAIPRKTGEQADCGIIFKVDCARTDTSPGRCVFSVCFQGNPSEPETFVYTGIHEGSIWFLPGRSDFSIKILEIKRGPLTIWKG